MHFYILTTIKLESNKSRCQKGGATTFKATYRLAKKKNHIYRAPCIPHVISLSLSNLLQTDSANTPP